MYFRPFIWLHRFLFALEWKLIVITVYLTTRDDDAMDSVQNETIHKE